jgi:methylated-DNA-[protein]-cysteine S-methyltransferase
MPSRQQYDAIVPAPFGAIGIRTDRDSIVGLDFLPPKFAAKPASNPLAAKAAQQVVQYLAQPGFRFDLPLAVSGTPFQRKVWQQISVVPTGKATTYGQIAKRIRSAPRAVGQACGANPLPLITPCHRVLTVSGGLGGFSGRAGDADFLLRVKSWLLAHEGVEVRS